jgi:Secretion system C-terminal sorting domain
MKQFFIILMFSLFISAESFAQKDTVVVPDYFSTNQEGTLNNSIDSVISAGGNISNVVFKLVPYGTYVLNAPIDLSNNPGATLEIDANPAGNTQQTAPPLICWSSSTSFDKTYLFDIAGKLVLKNIWILWADLSGTRDVSTIRIGDSSSVSGGQIEADNVIFDYVNQNSSGAIQPYATHFVGHFNNCYFRNATDPHFRYYSRAVSVPFTNSSTYGGLHGDTLSFENCTFANIGYVYMQEKDFYTNNVHFNHCTFYNVVEFPLESGVWWKMDVTNSLFINTFMFGYIPAAGGAGSGTVQIAPIDTTVFGADTVAGFGFKVPFTEQDRRILFANNDYYEQNWLTNWMGYNPKTQTLSSTASLYSKNQYVQRFTDEIPLPQPIYDGVTKAFFDSTSGGTEVWPFMNEANNSDSLDPRFSNPPINLDSLKTFLDYKWDTNSDIEWAWNVSQYANGSGGQIWPFVESLSYANDTLKTGAMGGFPLGDLYHWWPAQYAQWKTQEDAEHTRIDTWLESGKDPLTGIKQTGENVPAKYELSQNYPNPFNPTTNIDYTIPTSGFVTLKVFNILGQEVATLTNGYQKSGNYTATFNASNLASGVYLYRLEAGSVSITKKLVLLK